MLMGIGNVTELTEADTAGMNILLAAVCQELRIFSVLTTEVINWARSAVREFDFARRLIRHSVANSVLPKHLDSSLVMLRDARVNSLGEAGLEQLAAQLKDPGFRIFVEGDEIHLMNRDGHWRGTDAFELFDEALAVNDIDASHAFYLGYEMAKAVTAMTLGKQYNQDQALRWGMLTVPEVSAHERRKRIRSKSGSE
jgi:dihydropteroate synthase